MRTTRSGSRWGADGAGRLQLDALRQALDLARLAVDEAGRAALGLFGRHVSVRIKDDGSEQSAADLAAERAVVTLLRDRLPGVGLLSEEGGGFGEDRRTRWILDPIDGTRMFLEGRPYWGPMLALEHEGEIVVAAIGLPAQGRAYWAARGLGSHVDGQRLSVSTVRTWSDARVGSAAGWATESRSGVAELRETAYALDVARGPAAIARLASGRTDAWLAWGGMIWDFAPAKLLVEEAGGCVTSWRGDGDLAQGTALGTNGLLHGHALRVLRAASTSDGSGPIVAARRPVGAVLD